MYQFLTKRYKANQFVTNDAGDTPLLLAASINSKPMVLTILDNMKQTLWVFGPVRCVRYPLVEIEGDGDWATHERTVLSVRHACIPCVAHASCASRMHHLL